MVDDMVIIDNMGNMGNHWELKFLAVVLNLFCPQNVGFYSAGIHKLKKMLQKCLKLIQHGFAQGKLNSVLTTNFIDIWEFE